MKNFFLILSFMFILSFNIFGEEDIYSYYPNGEIQMNFLWENNKLSGISGGFYSDNKLIEKIDENDFAMFINSPDSDLLKYVLKNLYLNDVIKIKLKESKNSSSATFYDTKNKFLSREIINTAEKSITKVYWDEKNLKEVNETTDNTSISKFYNKNGVLTSEVIAQIQGINRDVQNLDDIESLKSNIENNIEIKEYFENTGTLKSVQTIINGKENLIEYNEDGTEKSNVRAPKNNYSHIIFFGNIVGILFFIAIIVLIKRIFNYFKNK